MAADDDETENTKCSNKWIEKMYPGIVGAHSAHNVVFCQRNLSVATHQKNTNLETLYYSFCFLFLLSASIFALKVLNRMFHCCISFWLLHQHLYFLFWVQNTCVAQPLNFLIVYLYIYICAHVIASAYA